MPSSTGSGIKVAAAPQVFYLTQALLFKSINTSSTNPPFPAESQEKVLNHYPKAFVIPQSLQFSLSVPFPKDSCLRIVNSAKDDLLEIVSYVALILRISPLKKVYLILVLLTS